MTKIICFNFDDDQVVSTHRVSDCWLLLLTLFFLKKELDANL